MKNLGYKERIGKVADAHVRLGKTPLRRPKRRWVDGIKITLQETMCEVVDYFLMAQCRVQLEAVLKTVTKLPFS